MSKVNDYLENIEQLILNGKKSMLTKGVIIDNSEALDLIKKVKMALPDEIKEANHILALREKRLRDAEEQAEAIVREARERADELENLSLIKTEEKITLAEEQAERIIAKAREQRDSLLDTHSIIEKATLEAISIKNAATGYRQSILKDVGGEIDSLLEGVEDILSKNINAIRGAREKASSDFNKKS